MAAVFLAFAVSPVMNTRQFGVGTTVAVLLDATVVRLVLLPALVKLLGERTWWVPRWLQRRPSGASASAAGSVTFSFRLTTARLPAASTAVTRIVARLARASSALDGRSRMDAVPLTGRGPARGDHAGRRPPPRSPRGARARAARR